MNAEPSPPTRNAPIALWRIAEAFMQLLFNLFGEPQNIARNSVIAAAAHKQLASWLACAEAMLRRLLLIEAAALAIPERRQRIRVPRQRVPRLLEFWPDKPQDWRVSFRCFPPSAGESAARRGRNVRITRTFRDAWPLALRYEALLRAYNDPAPYARRLSRHLHARPRRAGALLQAAPDAERRVENFAALTQAAAQARDRLCDTS